MGRMLWRRQLDNVHQSVQLLLPSIWRIAMHILRLRVNCCASFVQPRGRLVSRVGEVKNAQAPRPCHLTQLPWLSNRMRRQAQPLAWGLQASRQGFRPERISQSSRLKASEMGSSRLFRPERISQSSRLRADFWAQQRAFRPERISQSSRLGWLSRRQFVVFRPERISQSSRLCFVAVA